MTSTIAVVCLAVTGVESASPWTSSNVYAAVTLFDPAQLPDGLAVRVGSPEKRPEPVMVQDRPWEPRWDNGYPNVENTPGDPLGEWRVWWGGCCGGKVGSPDCSLQILEYANSTDGISWEKPNLGTFDFGKLRPDLKSVGKNNNILLKGGGIGVFRDEAPSASGGPAAFKAFGEGCFSESGYDSCVEGTAVSQDGLVWTGAEEVDFSKPQRYDCHTNAFWDERRGDYLVTTRDYLTDGTGRSIGLSRSSPGKWAGWNLTTELVLKGSEEHQLYSQISFPFYNMYLGLVMVFDTAEPSTVGTVECRLAWSADGDSWQIVGGYDKGPQAIPLGPAGAFDSHVVFAARPLPDRRGDDDAPIRMYYMGSNGPHSGPRNTSFGLAMLRPQGFVAVGGSRPADAGSFTASKEIECTGRTLVITADVSSKEASLRVGVRGVEGLSASDAKPVTGDATSARVEFEAGRDFSRLVGSKVTLEFEFAGDISLYTVGWVN